MKVRLPKKKLDVDWIKKNIKEQLDETATHEREKTTRRLIKLVCYILHNQYDFGKQRCTTVVMGIADLIEEGLKYWEGDVGDFWYKIDKELEFLGPTFYPTEDEIIKKEKEDNEKD